MPQSLEADVALIHIAGGGARITPPPGTIAQAAPRRAARGRTDNLIFLSLGLHSPRPVPPTYMDQLVRLSAEVYFSTPGSVTAALRAAVGAINDRLLDANRGTEEPTHIQGRLTIGVLRGSGLYLAQSGMGQVIWIRPGQLRRLSSDEAANRPLGLTLAPHIRFHHLEVQPGDLAILTTAPPPLWSDPTLSGLAGISLPQATDRLAAASGRDLTGLLLRIIRPGEGRQHALEALPTQAARSGPGKPAHRAARGHRTRTRPPLGLKTESIRQSAVGRLLGDLWRNVRRKISEVTYNVAKLATRMAPGLVEPPRPGAYSRAVLAATAVAVPLVVVAVASVVYMRRGRVEQFESYLTQAQAAVAEAQAKTGLEEARAAWETAIQWLNLAERYRESEETQGLRAQILSAIDELELIRRLDFRPLISGGFKPQARIRSLAATTTDLYVLDEANQVISHAWVTGRGYELDRDFQCLDGPSSIEGVKGPVDMVIQAEPGALGAEGVVAIDVDGTALYCAPGKTPLTSQLTPPDTGWGAIQAIDVRNDRLYVLDPSEKAVWIYDAADGLFSGLPVLFFTEEVPALDDAIDLAMAQDELFILHEDGHIDRCQRNLETTPDGSGRVRAECDPSPQFEDERPEVQATDHIPAAVPSMVVYSPPPEPSLFFLDPASTSVYHYSMRLVYQGRYQPVSALPDEVTALTVGPTNDIFLAAGDQVYLAQLIR